MKSLKFYIILAIVFSACADDSNLNNDISLPESETLFSPPAWLIGDWVDESYTNRFQFEIDNIRQTIDDTTINFTIAFPSAHEDYKTSDFYQLSAIIEDEIRVRYTFKRKFSNKLDYTLKIMGTGPSIELIKR